MQIFQKKLSFKSKKERKITKKGPKLNGTSRHFFKDNTSIFSVILILRQMKYFFSLKEPLQRGCENVHLDVSRYNILQFELQLCKPTSYVLDISNKSFPLIDLFAVCYKCSLTYPLVGHDLCYFQRIQQRPNDLKTDQIYQQYILNYLYLCFR